MEHAKRKMLALSDIKANQQNPRSISESRLKKLVNSILVFPRMLELRPIVIQEDNIVLGGNMRLTALNRIAQMSEDEIVAQLENLPEYNELPDGGAAVRAYWGEFLKKKQTPVMLAAELSETEKEQFIIKDNVSFGEWDYDELENWDKAKLEGWGVDMFLPDFGTPLTGGGSMNNGNAKQAESHEKLTERFVVPPFSVLNTREGYWKERKEAWNNIINENGESREGTLDKKGLVSAINSGVSILDPVLAELISRWFGIEKGNAFDCFAGDTVFGYVASYLGMSFTGIELREEQAALNNERTKEMKTKYICDDGQNVLKHIKENSQDLLFSCPPYFDLEVYSDLANDASNQETYEDFLQILDNAFTGAVKCLKENRFACIVVGDVRDKDGYYYDFVGDIKRIFRKNGVRLYNELILVEPVGTLPQRVQRYMRNRKVGKCHQNVLIFYKGDTKEIQKQYKEISYASEDLEYQSMD